MVPPLLVKRDRGGTEEGQKRDRRGTEEGQKRDRRRMRWKGDRGGIRNGWTHLQMSRRESSVSRVFLLYSLVYACNRLRREEGEGRREEGGGRREEGGGRREEGGG